MCLHLYYVSSLLCVLPNLKKGALTKGICTFTMCLTCISGAAINFMIEEVIKTSNSVVEKALQLLISFITIKFSQDFGTSFCKRSQPQHFCPRQNVFMISSEKMIMISGVIICFILTGNNKLQEHFTSATAPFDLSLHLD